MDGKNPRNTIFPTANLRGGSDSATHGGKEVVDDLVGLWILDQYRIVRVLAQGGMGRIYLAEQPSMDRYAAIKVLPARIEPEWRRRFRQEARAVSRLNHPNIITVYNFSELDDGSLFLAMEFLDGTSLAEILTAETLPIEQALVIGRQCAAALAYAHGKGVIHCDFKPDNVMVQHEGSTLHIKIVDFGLARLLEMGFSKRTGTLFGTPRYISPEQWAGEKTTALADQYAFGLVLYEMLAGAPAFNSESPLGYFHLHQHVIPRPPSAIRPGQGLERLDPLVLRLLAKEPGRRFAAMNEVEEELARAAGAHPLRRAAVLEPQLRGPLPSSTSATSPLRVALAGEGSPFAEDQRPRLEELGVRLVTDNPELWLLRLPGERAQELAADWRQRLPPERTLLVVDTPPEKLEGAGLVRAFPHLITGSCPIDPLVLGTAIGWIVSGERTGISLLPGAEAIHAIQIRSSDQKASAVDALLEEARAAGVRQWTIQALAAIAEEMVMNTIFDAPVGAEGKPRHAHLDRSSTVSLFAGEEAELRWMIGERYIAVSIRDPFGALQPEEALSRTTRAASPNPQFNQSGGGAGVGLHIIARATRHLFFGISPGNWSEVLALVDRRPQPREVSRTVSVLHGIGQSLQRLGDRLELITGRSEATIRLALRGEILEGSQLDPIFANPGTVRLDLSGVTRINSMGLKLLLEAWRRRHPRLALVLERCSLAVVSQLNMLPIFAEMGEVTSILAPYFCGTCNQEQTVLLHQEELAAERLPPVRLCPDCDVPLSFDAVPEEYFAFLQGDGSGRR